VQQHERHVAELVALQQRPQVERIGFDEVEVGVAKAVWNWIGIW